MAASNDNFEIFWKRLMSEHSPVPQKVELIGQFCFPIPGCSIQQSEYIFQKSIFNNVFSFSIFYLLKNQFQAFWKNQFL